MNHYNQGVEVISNALKLTGNTIRIIALTDCLFSCQQQLIREYELRFRELLLSLKQSNQLNVESMTLLYSAKRSCLAGDECLLGVNPLNLSAINWDECENLPYLLLDYEDKGMGDDLIDYYYSFSTPKINHLRKKAKNVFHKLLQARNDAQIYALKTDDIFFPKSTINRLERLYKDY